MNNKRFILLVLDGTGVGYMSDCKEVRPLDVGYNTVNSVVKNPNDFPNLKKLGLFNIAHNNFENTFASNGKFKLMHNGADTYFGHQEIMGSKPLAPIYSTVKDNVEIIKAALQKLNFKFIFNDYFLVEDKIIIADNLEADYGQIINISASTSDVKWEQILEIGKLVRNIVTNSRVIALGGSNTNIDKIISSITKVDDGRVGIQTPKSGIYDSDYQCLHMGYGIESKIQAQVQLVKNKIPVSLIGKIQDIVLGDNIWRKPQVDTNSVLDIMIERLRQQKYGLIAATVQETDLAGHNQDVEGFYNVLQLVDSKLEIILDQLTQDDILLITADHGNDPTNGSNTHTREYTPLIAYTKNKSGKIIGERETLSDIGATILKYFEINNTTNGTSFL